MEPLPEERSDVASGDRLQPTRPCLNGAAPGGAERLVVTPPSDLALTDASMEPLPEERSDPDTNYGVKSDIQLASMEPLPEERSDVLISSTNGHP